MSNFEVKIRTDYSSIEGIVLDCPSTALELDGSKWNNLAPYDQVIRSGNHTGTDNNSFLYDQNHFFINGNLIGCTVYNLTDGSSGLVTANANHSVTATLSGGTDNDWDAGDEYEIWVPRFGDPFQDRSSERPTVSTISGVRQAYFDKSSNNNFKIPLRRDFLSTGWCVAFDYLTQAPVGNTLPVISFPELEIFRQDGSGNYGYRHNTTSITGSGDMTAGTWLLNIGSSSGDLFNDGVVALSGSGSHVPINTNINVIIDGDMEQVGTDVIVDGDMEAAGISAWSASVATVTKQGSAYEGTQCLRVAQDSVITRGLVLQTILTIGKLYRVKGVARSGGIVVPSMQDVTGAGLWVGTTSTAWQHFDEYFIAGSTILTFRTIPGSGIIGDYIEFDAVEVIDQTTATSAWSSGNNALLSKRGGAYEGSQCLRIEHNGTADFYAYQTCLTIGETYRITGAARGDGICAPRIYDSTTILWDGTTSTSWQQFDFVFTAVSTELRFRDSTGNVGYIEVDGVEVLDQATIDGRIGANYIATAYTEIILAGVFMWRREVSPLEIDFIYDSLAADGTSHSLYSRAQLSLPAWTDDTGTGNEVSRLNAIDGYPHRFYKASIPTGTYRRVQVSVSIDGLVVPDSSLGGELFSIDCIEYASAGKPAVFTSAGWSSVFDIKLSDPGHYTFVVSRPNGGSTVLHLDVEAI